MASTRQARRKLRQLWLSSRWRLVVALSLAGFLVAVVGVPIPVYRARPVGEAYPCMDHACGCADAEHCWRHCCCYSTEEKLAWADAHHVAPPEYLLVAAEHEHSAQAGIAAREGVAAAEKPARRACCHAAKPAEVCHAAAAEQPAVSPAAPAAAQEGELIPIVASQYRQCHGLPQLWTVVGASTAPPKPVQFSFDWRVIDRLSTCSIAPISCQAAPPTPPPLG